MREHIASLPASQFKDKPRALVAEIESYASTHRLPMIFRTSKMDVARSVLAAMEPPPKVILEFGTYVGTSALAWGATLRELNGADATDLHVYSFELDSASANTARDFIVLSGLEDVVSVLEGQGSDSLKSLVEAGRVVPNGVDVVFIDHWEKFYLPDLRLCEELQLFRVGSVVVADNTDMPGAPDYVAYVKKGGSGETGAVRFESTSFEAAGQSRGPVCAPLLPPIAHSLAQRLIAIEYCRGQQGGGT